MHPVRRFAASRSSAAVTSALRTAALGGSSLAALFLGGLPAAATCTSYAPASGASVTCDGAETVGVLAAGSTGVTLGLTSGASIVPASGQSIALGDGASIALAAGTTVGSSAIATAYAVSVGNGSTVTVAGVIAGAGGIDGPIGGGGLSGLSGSTITVAQSGTITVDGTVSNDFAINGRNGGNTYEIDGTILATSVYAQGIGVGSGDHLTVGATGTITTQGTASASAVTGSTATGVTLDVAAGGQLSSRGLAATVLLGATATVTVGGTVSSLGNGAGVSVGAGSTVSVANTGTIRTTSTTSNAVGLYTGADTTIDVAGTIDTQRGHGILTGVGGSLTVESGGTVTARSAGDGILVNAASSSADHTVNVTVNGSVSALGSGYGLFVNASNAVGSTDVGVVAHVTIGVGGTLYAANREAYSQYDGAGSYPEVVDDLTIAGTVARGTAGRAINLDDGADTLTLLPTAVIVGSIDGGSDPASAPETDTFVFAGTIGTSGTFDFDTNAVSNFELARKTGAGDWTLLGTARSGIGTEFRVEAGRLFVDGSMTATTFEVQSGATLGGDGTVGGITALSGGIVAPSTMGTPLKVSGDVLFSAGSIYRVAVDESGGNTALAATGTVTVAGGTVDVRAADGTYSTSRTYTILTADGGVVRSGAANGFASVTTDLAFLAPSLSYDANDVVLTLLRNAVDFAAVAKTPNEKAAAAAAQALGSGDAVYDAALQLTATTAPAAFDSLSGEIHASLASVFLDDSRFPRDAAIERLRAAQHAPAAASSPVMAYGPGGPTEAPAATDLVAIWGRGFGAWGRFGGDGNAADLDRDVGGFLAGADAAVFDGWRLGVMAGWGRTHVTVDDRASSASSDDYHLGVYGGTRRGALGLRLGAAWTRHDVSTDRAVDVDTFADRARADYDADLFQGFGEVGWTFAARGFDFEPFAGLAAVSLHRGGFSESGGAAALAGGGETRALTYTTLGLRAATDLAFGDVAATLHGSAGWRHTFGDRTPTASLAFAGGDAFAIDGVPVAADVAAIEAGLDAKLGAATVGIAYSGQFGRRISDDAVKGTLTWRF